MKPDKKWIDKHINKLVEEINFYIKSGIDKKTAIKLVKDETILSKKYFQQVINLTSI